MNYFQSTKKESGGSALSETLIWENSDTTQSISTIPITKLEGSNLTQYDYYKLIYYTDTNNNEESSIIEPVGTDGNVYLTMGIYEPGVAAFFRSVHLFYSTTQSDYALQVGQSGQIASNAGVGSRNNLLIPKQIIGLKGTI